MTLVRPDLVEELKAQLEDRVSLVVLDTSALWPPEGKPLEVTDVRYDRELNAIVIEVET